MDFAFSEEQEELRSWARQFLGERYDAEGLAKIADSEGHDPDAWPRLAELGWLDQDLGFLDYAVLFEETGAALLPAPFFSTVALAGPALRSESSFAASVSRGEIRASLAWAEPDKPQGLLDLDGVSAAVGDGRLDTHKVLVPDTPAVDLVVVVARGAGGPGLYALRAGDAEVVTQPTLDGTRRLGEVRAAGADVQLLVGPDDAVGVLRDVRRWAQAAAACEAVGVTRRVLDLGAEYAKTREQFGRPIGVFQGVSYKLADTYVALQRARSLAYWAAWAVAENDPQVDRACLAAKSAAGDAAVRACEDVIQVHGGIGMTWDHELHRYYKRAQWLAAFDGSAREQRGELAAFLLD